MGCGQLIESRLVLTCKTFEFCLKSYVIIHYYRRGFMLQLKRVLFFRIFENIWTFLEILQKNLKNLRIKPVKHLSQDSEGRKGWILRKNIRTLIWKQVRPKSFSKGKRIRHSILYILGLTGNCSYTVLRYRK